MLVHQWSQTDQAAYATPRTVVGLRQSVLDAQVAERGLEPLPPSACACEDWVAGLSSHYTEVAALLEMLRKSETSQVGSSSTLDPLRQSCLPDGIFLCVIWGVDSL